MAWKRLVNSYGLKGFSDVLPLCQDLVSRYGRHQQLSDRSQRAQHSLSLSLSLSLSFERVSPGSPFSHSVRLDKYSQGGKPIFTIYNERMNKDAKGCCEGKKEKNDGVWLYIKFQSRKKHDAFPIWL
jgi:hypothetical protein